MRRFFRLTAGVVTLLAAWARAQDGGVPVERVLGVPDDGGVSAPAEPTAADAGQLSSEITGTIHGSIRVAGSALNAFPIDADGTRVGLAPIESRARLAPEVRFGAYSLVSEVDLVTGALFGVPSEKVVYPRTAVPSMKPLELRQLYFQYRWSWGAARLGLQTNHFGMGMLANAGASDSEPGEFGHQHFGSQVVRAAVAGRPMLSWGGAWRAFEPVAAFDLVVRDSTVDLWADGDRALQGILGARLVVNDDRALGLFAIFRSSRPWSAAAGERSTDVWVFDASAKWLFFDSLRVGAEVAAVVGTTAFTRTPDQPVVGVSQFGAVAKAAYQRSWFAFHVDWGLASGDSNPYDGQLTSFRFDRDYKVGLILYDHVLSWQSARSAWRASDGSLVGVVPEGVALIPTGGAVTGSWYVFPRVRARLGSFEVYGGPLFAFTTAPLTDPFNTRVLAGGTPLNSLGGQGRGQLGTELDVGASFKHKLTEGTAIHAVLEGGLLLPGPALSDGAGKAMGPVGLGRLRVTFQF